MVNKFKVNRGCVFAKEIQAKTNRPFAIKLFIPGPTSIISKSKLQVEIQATEKFRQELVLTPSKINLAYDEKFFEQLDVVLVKEIRKKDIYTIGTATNLLEALELQDSGVDAIVAQGLEAGGHRGIFDPCVGDPIQI